MAEYLVKWMIDIFDDDNEMSPEGVALEARGYIRDPNSATNVYHVKNKETGKCWKVDLDQFEGDDPISIEIEPKDF